jgi:membrane protein required for colicin V production
MAFDIPNMVDLAALIFAIFLMAKGLVRGFTGELFGFLGSVGGFILLWKYAPALAGMLKYKLGFSDIVAYIIAIAADIYHSF